MKKIFTLIPAMLVCLVLSAQTKETITPLVSHGQLLGITKPLSEITPLQPSIDKPKRKKPMEIPNRHIAHEKVNPHALPIGGDPLAANSFAPRGGVVITPIVDINGMASNISNVTPPDPTGDVGPNHYIQMINAASGALYQVRDKQGNSLLAPASCNTFWQPFGVTGLGDPVVLYDQIADRWFMSEFSNTGNKLLIAVSQTPSPLGQWYVYQFTTPDFPDYPKYSIWNNAYILTTNEQGGNAPVYALDRATMISGGANPGFLDFGIPKFGFGFEVVSPVDFDGTTPAPANSPALVVRMYDDAWAGTGADRIEVWGVTINWANPNSSSIAKLTDIPVTPFESEICTAFGSCITQSDGSKIDGLQQVIMNVPKYRNFGSHESMVFNHVVDVNANDQAGIRWYEMRKTGAGPWTLYQEGTFSPDSESRFMGSIGMDATGNIAMAYSMAGANSDPSLRYTGRYSADPLGQMTIPEYEFGTGANPYGSGRWGDYSQIGTDPSDDRTFWFTGEYMRNADWGTRIVSFQLRRDTNDVAPTQLITPSTAYGLTANEAISVRVQNYGYNAQSNFPISYSINGGAPVTETIVPTIAPDNFLNYTFSVPVDFSTEGNDYNVTVYTGLSNDEYRPNDTLHTLISHLWANEAGIISVLGLDHPVCATSTTASVVIKNFAGLPLTSATITYTLNGGTPVIVPWTGNVPYLGRDTFDINISGIVNGTNNLVVTVSLPNGGVDPRPLNDTQTVAFDGNTNGDVITLTLTTDSYGEEITWILMNTSGQTLYSGGPYPHGVDTYIHEWCLSDSACYIFQIFDSYGDGLTDMQNNGDYIITNAAGQQLVNLVTPNFGNSRTENFCTAVICTVNATAAVTNTTGGNNNGRISVFPSGGIAPYQFSLNGGAFGNSSIFNNLAPGIYTVLVRDVNGCEYTFNATILATGVSQLQSGVNLHVSPNPTTGRIDILVQGMESEMFINADLHDAVGRLVKHDQLASFNGELRGVMALSPLAAGVYYLRVYNEKYNGVVEIIKQ